MALQVIRLDRAAIEIDCISDFTRAKPSGFAAGIAHPAIGSFAVDASLAVQTHWIYSSLRAEFDNE